MSEGGSAFHRSNLFIRHWPLLLGKHSKTICVRWGENNYPPVELMTTKWTFYSQKNNYWNYSSRLKLPFTPRYILQSVRKTLYNDITWTLVWFLILPLESSLYDFINIDQIFMTKYFQQPTREIIIGKSEGWDVFIWTLLIFNQILMLLMCFLLLGI